MKSKLENGFLSVEIDSKGAELQSVMCDGVERIWCADPDVWGRRAPLLFPIIGRLRDGWYSHDGQRIDAPMHGFCRDREFEVTESSATELRLETASDEGTREVFPFDFHLAIVFRLELNSIVKEHIIQNTGTVPIPFEIGGHEAYATKLLPGESMSDYFIRFDGIDHIEMFGMDGDGILYKPKIRIPLEDGCLRKTPEQLDIDTVILEDVPGSTATLANDANGMSATVEFPDFPYLGIWTMAGQEDAGYICIEPWSALPDGDFIPRELSERPGAITVEPGQSKALSYRMTFR